MLASLWMTPSSWTQEVGSVMDLAENWRFQIGNHKEYADPSFDDRAWTTIPVPGCWEDAGYPGYDGYAWYRKSITIPSSWQDKNIILKLGRIDDVDQLFLNGRYVSGSGLFPPNFSTAADLWRDYVLPQPFIRWDQTNLIAVQVYDEKRQGGIVEGEVEILAIDSPLQLLLDLAGDWAFATGDDLNRRLPEYDDRHWKKIHVPDYWEMQNQPNYDGIAWYRKSFFLPNELAEQPLLLVLGYIDDVDETYWNGTLIGRTGEFPTKDRTIYSNNSKFSFRLYAVAPELARPDVKITIAVRVYDFSRWGGLYKGYIGLTSAAHWITYDQQKPENRLHVPFQGK